MNIRRKRDNNMKISTKGRYALRLMLDIAEQPTGKPVSIREISARQNISDKYLEQIISILNNAGFVRGIRGSQGGYVLKYEPDRYTVGMILRLTEGTLSPVPCVEEGAEGCERMCECRTFMVWKKLDEAVRGVVDHITLADLMEIGSDQYII